MTFGEMKTEVFRRLEEVEASPVFASEAEVEESINDGYEEISDATEWYESSATISMIAYRSYYNMHAQVTTETFLAPRRAWNTQTSRWLEPIDVRDLDFATYRRWESNTGEPQKIFMRGGAHLGIYPKVTADSGTFTAYFTAIPARLSTDSDEPAFPQEFHESLVEYALYDILAQMGETQKALRFWAKYLAGEQALSRYVQRRVATDRAPVLRRETGAPRTRIS